MHKSTCFFLILLLTIVSCQSKNETIGSDLSGQPASEPVQDTSGRQDKSGSGITFKIIPGESGAPGFGYDIYLEGKLYVHQPTIPAVSGNRTFTSEQKAIRAAQLVVYKIEHNILPPTIEIRELDSLHLLD